MCGRYTLTSAPEALRALFGYEEQPNFPPRYNIAPTQPIAIVRLVDGKRQFALVRWGLLPSWVKDPKTFSLLINARAKSGGPFAFAGLWETWTGPNGEELDTAAIVTTTANRTLSAIHGRMPVILQPDTFDLWLDSAHVDAQTAAALLMPSRDD